MTPATPTPRRQCTATSTDGSRCDRLADHYGHHSAPIRVSTTGLNTWTW